jgi:alpha-beta hydrolase superfamily lysophospholipase
MNVETAARRWIEGWRRAWPTGDVEGVAAMYTDDAVYSSHPFRNPDTARSYLERSFGEEKLVDAWFGDPLVAGRRASVEYWAVLRASDGTELTIAGAAFLRFDDDGRVTDHRDYWAQTGGARTPPRGWGG